MPETLLLRDPFLSLFWSPAPLLRRRPAGSTAPMDWVETPTSHIYKFDVPGFGREEVKVEVEEGKVLHIRGEGKEKKEEEEGAWHVAERGKGQLSRRLQLPEHVKIDHIRAAVDKGVLTVVLPKHTTGKTNNPRIVTLSSKL